MHSLSLPQNTRDDNNKTKNKIKKDTRFLIVRELAYALFCSLYTIVKRACCMRKHILLVGKSLTRAVS